MILKTGYIGGFDAWHTADFVPLLKDGHGPRYNPP